MIPKHEYQYDRLSDLVPAVAYDPVTRVYQLNDGGLAFMFACRPLVGSDDSMADRLAVLINQDWPKDTMMQISLVAGPDIYGFLQHYRQCRSAKHKFLQELNELQEACFLEGVQKGLYPSRPGRVRDATVFITVRCPGPADRPATEEERALVARRADAVESVLQSSYLVPVPVDPALYIRLMQTLFDSRENALWRRSTVPAYDELTPINEQICDPGVYVHRRSDAIDLPDGRVIQLLSTKRWPEKLQFGQARRYLGDLLTGSRGISEHCLMTLSIHFPDNEARRQKFATKRNWVTNALSGPLAKYVPQIAQQRESYDALFQSVDKGDRIVGLGFTIALFTTEEERTRASTNAITYMRECGFQFMTDHFVCLGVLLNALPMCCDPESVVNLQRHRSMAAEHAIVIAPLFADWKGTGTPMLTPISRAGQIMAISPFDSDESYNFAVAGSSGGGKSFMVNEMVVGALAMGGKAWVIDVGRSYSKICNILDGQLLDFDSNTDMCLNPFELVTNFKEQSDMLLHLLQSMASTNDPLKDVQVATMRKELSRLWDQHENRLLVDHVAEALVNNEDNDPRVRDVGRQLFAFTSKGEYGRYFNGKNNVRLDKDFVVIELEGLKERKQLLKVVLLLLIYRVRHDLTHGDRSQHKLFIVEEAWSLLEDEVAG